MAPQKNFKKYNEEEVFVDFVGMPEADKRPGDRILWLASSNKIIYLQKGTAVKARPQTADRGPEFFPLKKRDYEEVFPDFVTQLSHLMSHISSFIFGDISSASYISMMSFIAPHPILFPFHFAL